MSDIARAAGVSKGTLYVYFDNKEQLFEAIVHEECLVHAEGVFDFDHRDHDVEAVLTRLGSAYLGFLCTAEKASALRTVVAIADRMPEIGRVFYETGPAVGIAKLADLSQGAERSRRAGGGRLPTSPRRSSWIPASRPCSCRCCSISATPPQADAIKYVVGIAVRAFMRAYRANP